MKRILTVLLLCGMLLTSFTACGGTDTGADNTADTTSAADTTAVTEDPSKPDLPEKDYEGYKFVAGITHEGWANTTFDIAEQDGDVVNDAIFDRNRIVEEKYNVVIEQFDLSTSSVTLELINSTVMSGDPTYSMFTGQMFRMVPSATAGNFVNLHDVPYLDLSYDFWDQNAIEQLSIMNKLYSVTGDIHLGSFDATWMLFFDKQLAADNNLKSPYDYVDENKWTFETFAQLSENITKDLDGDGVFGDNDMWGFSTHASSCTALILAAGATFTEKTSDGTLKLAMDSEKFISAYEKMLGIIYDNNTTYESKSRGTLSKNLQATVFNEDRSLFFAEVMGTLSGATMRTKENDFGVIIWPKLDEAQDDYHVMVHHHAASLSIPVSVDDIERTGVIIQALAYESTDTVIKAYYDVSSKVKLVRDDRSADMLDLVFSSRMYDPIFVYEFLSSAQFEASCSQNNKDIASYVASNADAINEKIAELNEAYATLG